MDPWERVKPILESLWIGEKWQLSRIVQEMRTHHDFYRVESQYKKQFAIWKWPKNIRKDDMTKALKLCKGRAAVGKYSTEVAINGKPVDRQKIRRAIKDESREITRTLPLHRDQITTVDGHALPFTNSFFLKWNLPYVAIRHSYVRPFDHSSPFDQPTPQSNIEVTTPASAALPNDTPSPTVQVMKDHMMVDRARMFAQGHHDKLLKLLNGEERRTLSDWLYQYWFFCFKTAKHWGKGPRIWTADLLDFDHYLPKASSSLPGTPQDLVYPSTPHYSDEPTPLAPSDLCRWYIHVHGKRYEPITEDEFKPAPLAQHDPGDDSTWKSWSPGEQQASLQVHLRDALEHNDFSPTPTKDLPVAIPQIAKAADEGRSNELLVESLGFSIMSRNIDQIERVLHQLVLKNIDPALVRPFHIATAFLDGSKSCCDVVRMLALFITGAKVKETYLNEHGHTILDNLMIAIIKSHTVAKPVVVDNNLRDVARFDGEEVDICGRWDADSACVRQLHARGRPSIPSSWKHKFCNTSIQAICHCIEQMFRCMPNRLLLDTPSGLYIQHCFGAGCGKRLQLQPLHSLVMTAYHLATQGKDDEDLFGVLACALCLIFYGFDPSARADVSVTALISSNSSLECDHEELTAADLAERILALPASRTWNSKLATGWGVLAGVLRRCEAAHLEQTRNNANAQAGRYDTDSDTDSMELNESEDDAYFMGNTDPDFGLQHTHFDSGPTDYLLCFTGEKHLGTLWCSVQAELLSYRRLSEGLDWTSRNFSMDTLQEQLENCEDLTVGYAEHNLLKAHCACHCFGRYQMAVLSDAIDPNLANLDVWGRATYGAMIEY